jgi:hypothetical protein
MSSSVNASHRFASEHVQVQRLYLIRVNRQPASADQVLQLGDRVTITPTKIEGAKRAA